MNASSSDVLVTGARGFIGRMLVKHLMQEGKKVRVLTRGALSAPDALDGQIDVWEGDLADPATISGIANGIHTVYHLAGEIRDRRAFDGVNHHGTEHLLAQCQTSGMRRFLYPSSVSVMGARGAAGLLDETAPAHPRNAYEIGKYAGERAARLHHNANGIQVMVVRPTNRVR